jgi:hypothetical protein
MSKTVRLQKSRLLNSRSVIKTNKLLLNSFYTIKVFKKISTSEATARSGEANSETFIDLVKMSLPMAIASYKNAGKFRIKAVWGLNR